MSLHPCVIQYRCPKVGCQEAVTEYIIYISDDLKHDAGFTKTVLSGLLEHLKEKNFSAVTVFSDGCSAQYKSKVPFVHLTELASLYPEMTTECHYFGSHHGKSLCDSVELL